MILINNREKGGKLKVSEIKNLLNASYEPKDIVDDFRFMLLIIQIL